MPGNIFTEPGIIYLVVGKICSLRCKTCRAGQPEAARPAGKQRRYWRRLAKNLDFPDPATCHTAPI